MKKIVFYASALVFLAACGNADKEKQAVSAAVNEDTAAVAFFPVTSFIKGQMLQLDSVQVTPLEIITANNKTDSIWIKREQLRPLLKDFISFEINETNLQPFFTESKFNDESTEAITFTYKPKTTLPDSIAVRNWDAYVTQQTGQVKRVYVVKKLLQDGKIYTQQLTWQTDKFARITTISDQPDGRSEIVKDIKIVWGF